MRELNLKLEHIQASPLLRGELYWCRPSGRKLCIGHAGEFVNIDLASKLASTNDQFTQSIIIDEERVYKNVDHFMDLKKSQIEDVKLRFRNLILLDFYRSIKGEYKASTLDFIFICHEVFYDLSSDGLDLEESFIRTNIVAFKRAQVVASALVYMALVTGYLDFYFLKEVFNTVLVTYYSYYCKRDKVVNVELALTDMPKAYQSNKNYLKNLTHDFFELEYNLSDDISAIWHKIHLKVFNLELNFAPNDIENIISEILKDVKEYRYLAEIFSQEDIGRSA